MNRPAPGLPWLGVVAVVIGAVATSLASRLTSIGLADVRGAVGAGFDEGAWITTAFSASQMLIGPISVFFGRVFSPRRVLLTGCAMFGLAELAIPFSPDLATLLFLQCMAGLGSGTFIPMTAPFVLMNFPKQHWPLGLAAYAMNVIFGLNVAPTLEGWYVEHWSIDWVFWQNTVLAVPLFFLYWFGLRTTPVDREWLRHGDFTGMVLAGSALTLIFIALDQGDRLDWFSSTLIRGLLAAGVVAAGCFLLFESTLPTPSIDFRFLFRRNVALLVLLVCVTRFLVTSSNTLVANFLIQVRGLRPLDAGSALLWVALPQFIIAPMTAWTLRRIDPRVGLGVGLFIACCGFLLCTNIDSSWSEADFRLPLLLQAVGETLEFTSLVYFFGHHSQPSEGLTVGATIQSSRLFGGEIGVALLVMFTRKAEQWHSNLTGQHVVSGAPQTLERLATYAGMVDAGSQGTTTAHARALGLLAQAVGKQAYTLSIVDGFILASVVGFVGLGMTLCLMKAPVFAAAPVAKATASPAPPARVEAS